METPVGNLVAGRQWLQATFANLFNRLRGERGHLFQGRYKALLVELGWPLGAQAFKMTLVKDHTRSTTSRGSEASGAREICEAQWAELLGRGCRVLRHELTAAPRPQNQPTGKWRPRCS